MLAIIHSKQMEEEETHDIFKINPIEQADFTQKNVKIILKNSEVLEGLVYTIDPVSQSVVLISKNDNKTPVIKIVMNHSIESMEKISNMDTEQKTYFDNLCAVDKKDFSLQMQKEKVKCWLKKNFIPVIENNKILKVETLEIHPPYGPDQCFSGNSIVLSRIQTLLSQIPMES